MLLGFHIFSFWHFYLLWLWWGVHGKVDFPLEVGQNVGKLISNGYVKLVERAALEKGAGALKCWEIIERVNVEEIPVSVGIRKIITRDIGQSGEAFIDMVFARIVDDVLRNSLLVSKDSLVVLECCQVAINHLGMVSHTNSKSPGSSNSVLNPPVDSIFDIF